jgi:hypothetical protein
MGMTRNRQHPWAKDPDRRDVVLTEGWHGVPLHFSFVTESRKDVGIFLHLEIWVNGQRKGAATLDDLPEAVFIAMLFVQQHVMEVQRQVLDDTLAFKKEFSGKKEAQEEGPDDAGPSVH